MNNYLNIRFEKAIRLITEHFPISDENSRKPLLFHDLRVGIYLYEKGYSEDVVLAGVLHDTIEWSDITEEILKKEFGENVVKLVLASTKDKLVEKSKRNTELIKRCVENGQDALTVKVADTIDSFKWYYSQNNKDQLENHCLEIADLIFENKPKNFDDNIFSELKNWQNKIRKMI